MFKCQLTNKQSKPLEKPVRIVTKTRPKEYWGEIFNRKTKEMERKLFGKGFEIVEEKVVLAETAELMLNAQQDKQKN